MRFVKLLSILLVSLLLLPPPLLPPLLQLQPLISYYYFYILQANQYAKAIKKYKLITKWLDDDAEFDDEQKAQRNSLQLAAHLNCALCYNKEENWSEAKKECNEALGLDKNSEKALFRRGQVYIFF